MGKKSLKIKVDGLSDESYVDAAHEVVKAVKAVAPECRISILGASPETFEGKNQKQIKGK